MAKYFLKLHCTCTVCDKTLLITLAFEFVAVTDSAADPLLIVALAFTSGSRLQSFVSRFTS